MICGEHCIWGDFEQREGRRVGGEHTLGEHCGNIGVVVWGIVGNKREQHKSLNTLRYIKIHSEYMYLNVWQNTFKIHVFRMYFNRTRPTYIKIHRIH